MSYAPTEEQQAIIECNDPLVTIEAFAGTGKTATLVKFAEARASKKILYLVFGKANERDATKKFAYLKNVDVMTVHKMAYRELGKELIAGRKLGNLRPYDLVRFFPGVEEEIAMNIAQAVVLLAREYFNSSMTLQNFAHSMLINKREYEKKNGLAVALVLETMIKVINQMLTSDSMPIEHDYYLKLWQLTNPVLEYDVILVDEAQDISDAMIDVVIRQTHAQRIFIGDNYQQIFSWRGAVNALGKLSSSSTKLSLTQTFRCPQNIAKEADLYLKLLGADKTLVSAIKGGDVLGWLPTAGKDECFTFIARTNAGILRFLANDKSRCRLFFVGGFDSYNFRELYDLKALQFDNHDKIYSPFLKNFKDLAELEEYASNAGENTLLTQIKTIRSIPNITKLISDTKARITRRPSEADIVFTTAHRSKGLEFNNVALGSDFFYVNETLGDAKKSKRVLQNFSWEELNLLYVAITRAKKKLYIDPDLLLDKNEIPKMRDLIIDFSIK